MDTQRQANEMQAQENQRKKVMYAFFNLQSPLKPVFFPHILSSVAFELPHATTITNHVIVHFKRLSAINTFQTYIFIYRVNEATQTTV